MINPYVRRAMYSVLETAIERRVILDYELIYIEEGTLHLIYNSRDFYFEKGAVLLLSPGVPHSFVLEKGRSISQPHIHFDMEFDRFSKDVYICYKDLPFFTDKDKRMLRTDIFGQRQTPLLEIRNKDQFIKTMFELIDTYGENTLYTKALAVNLIQTVIEDNFKNRFDENKENSLTAVELKGFIDSNCNRKLNLEILEGQFHYSRFYLEKEFKARYGYSIMNYYNEKRLEKAKELLKDMTVTQTATALEYSSIYTFSRAYKNKFGVSPSK